MSLETFELLVKSEVRARRHIAEICWKGGHSFCPRCGGRKVYRVRRQKYRCKHCWYEFSDWSGRWIGQLRITARDWLRIVKLFELEVSALRACKQVALSYPTVLKGFNLIRKSIAASSEDGKLLLRGEVEVDESYFGGRRKGNRGRGAAGKVPVFGILERQGVVKVEVVPNVSAETLLGMTVKMVRRGSIVYTDKFGSYDSLMFCGYRHLRVDHQRRFSSGKVYINGLEGFWSYAKERLIKHHGVSKELFPFYLKEMEFRYNHRHDNLFNLLLNSICLLVANRL
jgi:transposase